VLPSHGVSPIVLSPLYRFTTKNITIENRGRRHLKYPIKKVKDGVYIQMNYEANGEVINLIERSMKINESIIRYMTTAVK